MSEFIQEGLVSIILLRSCPIPTEPLEGVKTTMDPSDGNVDHSLIIGFDVFAIVIILYTMLLMLTAALSRQVQRRASWFNFMLPVMFYAASFFLSIGAQGSQELTNVPHASCVMQAALIYALPV